MKLFDYQPENEIEKEFLIRGYSVFDEDILENSLLMFQKRFTDGNGIKFFLTFRKFNIFKAINKGPDEDLYQASVQFVIDKEGKHQVVDIKFSSDLIERVDNKTTIEEVETFFDRMFYLIQADYYERID